MPWDEVGKIVHFDLLEILGTRLVFLGDLHLDRLLQLQQDLLQQHSEQIPEEVYVNLPVCVESLDSSLATAVTHVME